MMGNLTVIGFFMPGPFEFAIIAGVFLLLFSKRLPGVMRSLGSSIVEFKKGIGGTGDDDSEKSDAEDSGKSES